MSGAESVGVVVDPSGRHRLVAVAKRTYAFSQGRVRLADLQAPVVEEPELTVFDDGSIRDLVDDADVLALKQATDVVVRGAVRSASPFRSLDVAVAVGPSARRLRLSGPRRAEIAASGAVRFEPPAPTDEVTLGLERAHGGHDEHAQRLLDPEYEPPACRPDGSTTLRMVGIFAYPRNALGGSYFIDIDRRRADGAILPSIEDPEDPLTPARFFVPEPLSWIDAPVPGSLGWIPHVCYPRIARFLGPILPHARPFRPIREAAFPDGDDLPNADPRGQGRVHPRALQGASPGLARARLAGDEPVRLENLLPSEPDLSFSLPGETPTIWIRPPDLGAIELRPLLQTVRIDLDRRLVSLAFAAAIRLAAPPGEGFLEATALRVAWTGRSGASKRGVA